jgi:hypothetical protein
MYTKRHKQTHPKMRHLQRLHCYYSVPGTLRERITVLNVQQIRETCKFLFLRKEGNVLLRKVLPGDFQDNTKRNICCEHNQHNDNFLVNSAEEFLPYNKQNADQKSFHDEPPTIILGYYTTKSSHKPYKDRNKKAADKSAALNTF